MAIRQHQVGDDIEDLALSSNDILRWQGGSCWCLVYGCQPALEFDWYLIPPGISVDANTASVSDQTYKRICFCFGAEVQILSDPKLVVN